MSSPGLDDADADVILRSADRVDFPMLKSDLARSSLVFRGMFALPLLRGAAHADGLPVVDLPESSACLRALLAFCRLGPQPPLDECSVAVLVLEGAKKYEVSWAYAAACRAMERFVEMEPVRTYCVACRYGLPGLAAACARACLRPGIRSTLTTTAEEVAWISSEQLRRLLLYVEECGKALQTHIEGRQWVQTAFPKAADRFWEGGCAGGCPVGTMTYAVPIGRAGTSTKKVQPALWWELYMKEVVTELRRFPSEERIVLGDAFKVFLERTPCSDCCTIASKRMSRFVQTLKEQVSFQISKVSVFGAKVDTCMLTQIWHSLYLILRLSWNSSLEKSHTLARREGVRTSSLRGKSSNFPNVSEVANLKLVCDQVSSGSV